MLFKYLSLRCLSVKWKIYSIVIVSVIGFGAYLGFNIWVNYANAKILTDVKDIYFPILEKSNRSAVYLDRMNETLLTAVQTGEYSFIQQAQATADDIKRLLSEVYALEPVRKIDLEQVLTDFSEYFSIANTMAVEMVDGTVDYDKLPERIQRKEEIYEVFREELDEFIVFSQQRFESDIATANSNSEASLVTGFLIWIANVLLLTGTVYTIAKLILDNINMVSRSLKAIAAGNGDFNKTVSVVSNDEIGRLGKSFNNLLNKLKEKTNDLTGMMQNMHQGLFTITGCGTVHPEYSSYVEKIFECTNIAGQPYEKVLFEYALLGSDDLAQVKTAIDSMMNESEMMWLFNSHLLPNEYQWQCDGKTKIIELAWDPIFSDEILDKVMVTARDVTELRALQIEAEAQKAELQMVGHILSISIEKFDRFHEVSSALIGECRSLLTASSLGRDALIAELFVKMHAIKGNARTLGLDAIKDIVHDAENAYDNLRKDKDARVDKAKLLNDLDKVESNLNRYLDIRQNKLGFLSKESSVSDAAEVSAEVLQSLVEECEHILNNDLQKLNRARMRQAVNAIMLMQSTPLNDVLQDIIDSLPAISRELGKVTPTVTYQGASVRVNNSCMDLLQSVFTHLLRNSLDHGLEATAEREVLGKSSAGNITIESNSDGDNLQVAIYDDGRGLALQKLKQKALALNLIDGNNHSVMDIANVIFASGCSTADAVTDISGRGVGMDAVRSFLQSKGCDIAIVLPPNAQSTDEFSPFQLVLQLSESVAFIWNE